MAFAETTSPWFSPWLACGMLCWLFAGPAYAAIVDVSDISILPPGRRRKQFVRR